MIGTNAVGQTNLDRLCADREEVAIWPLHRHGVGEIDEMDRNRASVLPRGDIEETRSIEPQPPALQCSPKELCCAAA